MNLSLESLDGLLSLFLFFSFFSDLPIFAEEQKKKFEGPDPFLYTLFSSRFTLIINNNHRKASKSSPQVK
jgi:hypothetical protein